MVKIKEHNPRYLESMNYIMDTRGLNLDMFAKTIEVGRTTLSQVRSGAQNASIDVVANTCMVYSEINANYILTGRGSMLNQEQETNDEATIKELKTALDEATSEIERLREENNLLRTAFGKLQTS